MCLSVLAYQEVGRRIEELTGAIYALDPYFVMSTDEAATLSMLVTSARHAQSARRARSPERRSLSMLSATSTLAPQPSARARSPWAPGGTTYAEIVKGAGSRSSSRGEPRVPSTPPFDDQTETDMTPVLETCVISEKVVDDPSDTRACEIDAMSYDNSVSESYTRDVNLYYDDNNVGDSRSEPVPDLYTSPAIEYQEVHLETPQQIYEEQVETVVHSLPEQSILELQPTDKQRSLSPFKERQHELSYAEILALGLRKQPRTHSVSSLPKPQVAHVELVKEIVVECVETSTINQHELKSEKYKPERPDRLERQERVQRLERPDRPTTRSRSREILRQRRAPEKRTTKAHDVQVMKKKKTMKKAIEVQDFDEPDVQLELNPVGTTPELLLLPPTDPIKEVKEVTKKLKHSATVVETVTEIITEDSHVEKATEEIELKKSRKKKSKKTKSSEDEIQKALKEIEELEKHKKKRSKEARDNSKEKIMETVGIPSKQEIFDEPDVIEMKTNTQSVEDIQIKAKKKKNNRNFQATIGSIDTEVKTIESVESFETKTKEKSKKKRSTKQFPAGQFGKIDDLINIITVETSVIQNPRDSMNDDVDSHLLKETSDSKKLIVELICQPEVKNDVQEVAEPLKSEHISTESKTETDFDLNLNMESDLQKGKKTINKSKEDVVTEKSVEDHIHPTTKSVIPSPALSQLQVSEDAKNLETCEYIQSPDSEAQSTKKEFESKRKGQKESQTLINTSTEFILKESQNEGDRIEDQILSTAPEIIVYEEIKAEGTITEHEKNIEPVAEEIPNVIQHVGEYKLNKKKKLKKSKQVVNDSDHVVEKMLSKEEELLHAVGVSKGIEQNIESSKIQKESKRSKKKSKPKSKQESEGTDKDEENKPESQTLDATIAEPISEENKSHKKKKSKKPKIGDDDIDKALKEIERSEGSKKKPKEKAPKSKAKQELYSFETNITTVDIDAEMTAKLTSNIKTETDTLLVEEVDDIQPIEHIDWNEMLEEEEGVIETAIEPINQPVSDLTMIETEYVANQVTILQDTGDIFIEEKSALVNEKIVNPLEGTTHSSHSKINLENVEDDKMITVHTEKYAQDVTSPSNEQNNNDKFFSTDTLKESSLNVVEEVTHYEPITPEMETRTVYLITHEEKKLPPIRTVKIRSKSNSLEEPQAIEENLILSKESENNKITVEKSSIITGDNILDRMVIAEQLLTQENVISSESNLTESLLNVNKNSPESDQAKIQSASKSRNDDTVDNSVLKASGQDNTQSNITDIEPQHQERLEKQESVFTEESFSGNFEGAIFGSVQDRNRVAIEKINKDKKLRIPYQELVKEIKSYAVDLDTDQLDYEYTQFILTERSSQEKNKYPTDIVSTDVNESRVKDVYETNNQQKHNIEDKLIPSTADSMHLDMQSGEKYESPRLDSVQDTDCITPKIDMQKTADEVDASKSLNVTEINIITTHEENPVKLKGAIVDKQDKEPTNVIISVTEVKGLNEVVEEKEPRINYKEIKDAEMVLGSQACNKLTKHVTNTNDNTTSPSAVLRSIEKTDDVDKPIIESIKTHQIIQRSNSDEFTPSTAANEVDQLIEEVPRISYHEIKDAETVLATQNNLKQVLKSEEKHRDLPQVPSKEKHETKINLTRPEPEVKPHDIQKSLSLSVERNEDVILGYCSDNFIEAIRKETPRHSYQDMFDAEIQFGLNVSSQNLQPDFVSNIIYNETPIKQKNINQKSDETTELTPNTNITEEIKRITFTSKETKFSEKITKEETKHLSSDKYEMDNTILIAEIPKSSYQDISDAESLLALKLTKTCTEHLDSKKTTDNNRKQVLKPQISNEGGNNGPEGPLSTVESGSAISGKFPGVFAEPDTLRQSIYEVPRFSYHEIRDAEGLLASTERPLQHTKLTSVHQSDVPVTGTMSKSSLDKSNEDIVKKEIDAKYERLEETENSSNFVYEPLRYNYHEIQDAELGVTSSKSNRTSPETNVLPPITQKVTETKILREFSKEVDSTITDVIEEQTTDISEKTVSGAELIKEEKISEDDYKTTKDRLKKIALSFEVDDLSNTPVSVVYGNIEDATPTLEVKSPDFDKQEKFVKPDIDNYEVVENIQQGNTAEDSFEIIEHSDLTDVLDAEKEHDEVQKSAPFDKVIENIDASNDTLDGPGPYGFTTQDDHKAIQDLIKEALQESEEPHIVECKPTNDSFEIDDIDDTLIPLVFGDIKGIEQSLKDKEQKILSQGEKIETSEYLRPKSDDEKVLCDKNLSTVENSEICKTYKDFTTSQQSEVIETDLEFEQISEEINDTLIPMVFDDIRDIEQSLNDKEQDTLRQGDTFETSRGFSPDIVNKDVIFDKMLSSIEKSELRSTNEDSISSQQNTVIETELGLDTNLITEPKPDTISTESITTEILQSASNLSQAVTDTQTFTDVITQNLDSTNNKDRTLTKSETPSRVEKSPIHSLHDLLPEIDSIPEFKPSYPNTVLYSKLSADAPEFTPSYMYQTITTVSESRTDVVKDAPLSIEEKTSDATPKIVHQISVSKLPETYSTILQTNKEQEENILPAVQIDTDKPDIAVEKIQEEHVEVKSKKNKKKKKRDKEERKGVSVPKNSEIPLPLTILPPHSSTIASEPVNIWLKNADDGKSYAEVVAERSVHEHMEFTQLSDTIKDTVVIKSSPAIGGSQEIQKVMELPESSIIEEVIDSNPENDNTLGSWAKIVASKRRSPEITQHSGVSHAEIAHASVNIHPPMILVDESDKDFPKPDVEVDAEGFIKVDRNRRSRSRSREIRSQPNVTENRETREKSENRFDALTSMLKPDEVEWVQSASEDEKPTKKSGRKSRSSKSKEKGMKPKVQEIVPSTSDEDKHPPKKDKKKRSSKSKETLVNPFEQKLESVKLEQTASQVEVDKEVTETPPQQETKKKNKKKKKDKKTTDRIAAVETIPIVETTPTVQDTVPTVTLHKTVGTPLLTPESIQTPVKDRVYSEAQYWKMDPSNLDLDEIISVEIQHAPTFSSTQVETIKINIKEENFPAQEMSVTVDANKNKNNVQSATQLMSQEILVMNNKTQELEAKIEEDQSLESKIADLQREIEEMLLPENDSSAMSDDSPKELTDTQTSIEFHYDELLDNISPSLATPEPDGFDIKPLEESSTCYTDNYQIPKPEEDLDNKHISMSMIDSLLDDTEPISLTETQSLDHTEDYLVTQEEDITPRATEKKDGSENILIEVKEVKYLEPKETENISSKKPNMPDPLVTATNIKCSTKLETKEIIDVVTHQSIDFDTSEEKEISNIKVVVEKSDIVTDIPLDKTIRRDEVKLSVNSEDITANTGASILPRHETVDADADLVSNIHNNILSNIDTDTNNLTNLKADIFWTDKHTFDDAEKVLIERNSVEKAITSEKIDNPRIVRGISVEENISNDNSFWPEKHMYHDAECHYFLSLASKTKIADTESSKIHIKDENDKDRDQGGSSGHTSDAEEPKEASSSPCNSSYISMDLPGGICSWRDKSSYLSTETPTVVDDLKVIVPREDILTTLPIEPAPPTSIQDLKAAQQKTTKVTDPQSYCTIFKYILYVWHDIITKFLISHITQLCIAMCLATPQFVL